MKRETKLGILILIASLGSLVVLIGTGTYFARKNQLNSETLCREDVDLVSHTVLIVDKTDPLDEGQVSELQTLVRGLKHELKTGEKLSIFLIHGIAEITPVPVFSLCSPGYTANELYQNPERYRKQFEEKFALPLDEIMEELTKGEVSKSSPIMETIRGVLRRGDFSQSIANRRMILLSDMLQNVPPYYSQYKRSQTFDEFIGLEYSKNALSDLVGVKVVIHYIERSGATQFQTSDHAEFWQDYFFNCGAKEVSFQ